MNTNLTDTFYNQNIAKIADFILKGCKKTNRELLGFEIEHMVLNKKTYLPLSYYDKMGQEWVLNKILSLNSYFKVAAQENGHILALECNDYSISLEPGGQIEVSIKAESDLGLIKKIYEDFRNIIDPILNQSDSFLVNIGYLPFSCAKDIKLIPKKRYELMDNYFKATGTCGIQMMRATCATQVSIDYEDEKDIIKKLKVAFMLSPVFKFLSSNIPFYEKKENTNGFPRNYIWENTDTRRTEFPSNLFDNSFTILDYAKFVYETAPIFINKKGMIIPTREKTAAELYNDSLITDKEISHLLSIVFPDVRLKNVMEFRFCDSMPIDYALSYGALIKGIFYKEKAISKLEKICLNIDFDKIKQSVCEIENNDYSSNIYGVPIVDFIQNIFNIVRNELDDTDFNYLRPFVDLINTKSHISNFRALNMSYIKTIDALSGDEPGKQLSQNAMNDGFAYVGNKVASISFLPLIFPKSYRIYFEEVAKNLYSLLHHCLEQYRRELGTELKPMSSFLNLDSRIASLIKSVKSNSLPFVRADFLFDCDNKRLVFCEINTDASSGMAECAESVRAIKNSLSFSEFNKIHKVYDDVNLLWENWAKTLINCYKTDNEKKYIEITKKRRLNVAAVVIFDTPEANVRELSEYAKIFDSLDVNFAVYDARNLYYSDKKLIGKKSLFGMDNMEIDCIWRYTIVSDLLLHWSECSGYINAIKDNAVSLYGSFITEVVHDKRFFALLTRKKEVLNLSAEQLNFINSYIPPTDIVPLQINEKKDEVVVNKDLYILKPVNLYCGKNVLIGKNTSLNEWLCALHSKDIKYIYQQFNHFGYDLVIPLYSDCDVKNAKIQNYNSIYSMYIIDSKFAGLYVRSSPNLIVKTGSSEICVPVLWEEGLDK